MMLDEQIREMVNVRQTAGVIKQKAIEKGLQTLRMDGARKVMVGATTIAEVLRVTQADV
jgi:general secretion pathway protein E